MISFLSTVTGNNLEVVSMNSDTDASDLLGGFEQVQRTSLCSNSSRDYLFNRVKNCKSKHQTVTEQLAEGRRKSGPECGAVL